jgi:hypothetical protein
LDLCRRLAGEAAARLNAPWLNDEGEGAPFRPYFAAAVVGEPVPTIIDAELIRAVFGSTIHAAVGIHIKPPEQRGGRWDAMPDAEAAPRSDADLDLWGEELCAASDTFGRWFHAVPGLSEHSLVSIGYSDTDPGAVKPRLVVALTPAGSLVGAASHVVQG